MADKSKEPTNSRPGCRAGWPTAGRRRSPPRGAMLETIRKVYERYGFEPVETPAIEYTDALGKFLPDQDRPNEGVFSFQDDDEQWLSLRYDLTAPLARYVAENFDTLPKPYRSYRFGWVFRNEKPGPGRFRQFMQFDADTVGSVLARRRRRDVHDGRGHDGGARHSARQLIGEGEQPKSARWRDGNDRTWRRQPTPGSDSLCCVRSTNSIGWDEKGWQLCLAGPQRRKRRFYERRRAYRKNKSKLFFSLAATLWLYWVPFSDPKELPTDDELIFSAEELAKMFGGSYHSPSRQLYFSNARLLDGLEKAFKNSVIRRQGVDELRQIIRLTQAQDTAPIGYESFHPSSAVSNITPARYSKLN